MKAAHAYGLSAWERHTQWHPVIVCPGGGYGTISVEHEGVQFAEWLGRIGVTTFVLKYRLKEFGHPAPLQDVLRAVRLVRSRAAEFGINPGRIGVMGSSAGGYLAACAGTLFEHPAGRTGAVLDAVSARPDFLVLMYSVITINNFLTHAGSRQALLGAHPAPALLQLMSVEKQVTAATPPTLLIHTQEDKNVPVENSLLFFQALTRAQVPAEMYVFEHGAHGMGMKAGLGTASGWPKRAEEWLRCHGLLAGANPSRIESGGEPVACPLVSVSGPVEQAMGNDLAGRMCGTKPAKAAFRSLN